MTSSEEIGTRIREARLGKSMSLGQLASAVGRSSSSVRRWERGEVAPAVSVVPKLAAILEIDPSDLRPVAPVPAATDSDTPESTIEQPVVNGTSSEVIAVASTEGPAPEASSGLVSDAWRTLTSTGNGWMGWIRGLLTAGLLLVMLLVLVWAFGELIDALDAVLDSFDAGSSEA